MAGMNKPAPKKPYAKSHQEFIGNPSLEGGKTAKAKADYKKAVKGGAAKTAAKLVKQDVKYLARAKAGQVTGIKDKVVINPRTEERKATAQRIANDKSKTATRAKNVEMKAIKNKTK